MNVKATDKATQRSQHITITASSGLSKDEVERMRKEGELHAAEDKKKKEMIEVRNVAENAIYSSEKLIKDNAEKIPADIKKQVEEDIAAIKQVKDGDDIPAIQAATEKLNQDLQKLGASMYQQPGAGGQDTGPMPGPGGPTPGGEPGGPAPKGPEGEDVVDGEFKNV